VEVNEVAYFFTKDKANFIMTHDNRSFLVDYTLDDLEKAVDPKKFFRANRHF
jgi:two-component system LytT family response regulator